MKRNYKRVASLVLSFILLFNTALSSGVSTRAEGSIDSTELEVDVTENTSEEVTTELSTEEVTTTEATTESTTEVVSTEETTEVSTEEVSTEEVTEEVISEEISTEEVSTEEVTTEEVKELTLIEEVEQGIISYTDMTEVEKMSFFKNTLTNVEYREWFKKLSNDQIKQYFGLEKEDFLKEMIHLLLEDEPQEYLLDLPEDDIQIIFNMTIEEFEVYYEDFFNSIAEESEMPSDYALGTSGSYSFYIHDSYDNSSKWYPINVIHATEPLVATWNYGGRTLYLTCCESANPTPFDWHDSYYATTDRDWNLTWDYSSSMNDVYWEIAKGKEPNAVMSGLPYGSGVNDSGTYYGVNGSLSVERSNPSNRTSPTSSSFVVSGLNSISFSIDGNVQKSQTLTVKTGTPNIQAKITYPAGLDFHYKTKDANGNWVWKTKSNSTTDWLGFVSDGNGGEVVREFYFTAPLNANISGTITVESATNNATETGYYIECVGIMDPAFRVQSDSGNWFDVQALAMPWGVNVSKSGSVNVSPVEGYLSLKKSPKNPTIVNGRTDYTLKRATYNVYDVNGNVVAKFETDENGTGHVVYDYYNNSVATKTPHVEGSYVATTDTHTILKLPVGNYTVKEVEASYIIKNGVKRYCYSIDTNTYSVSITSDKTPTSPALVNSIESEDTEDLKLVKESVDPAVTDNNNMYDLTGSEYTVWEVSSATATKESGKIVGKFKIINNNGDAKVTQNIYYSDNVGSNTMKLPYGYYIVMETKEPDDGHYCLSYEEFKVHLSVNPEETKGNNIVAKEPFENDPFSIVINKKDAETNTAVQGAGGLENAIFKICYYDTLDSIDGKTAKATWYLKTIKNPKTGFYEVNLNPTHLVSSSEYPSSDLYEYGGEYIIPLGTLTLEEYTAPEGYTKEGVYIEDNKGGVYTNNKVILQIKESNGDIGTFNVLNQPLDGGEIAISEQPIRGDFLFVKMDYETREVMANIPFEIESLTTGEKHVIYTNDQGIATTSSSFVPHTLSTNSNDNLTDYNNGSVTGIWFGDVTKVDNSKGALPYDNYIVRELRCDANEGKTLETFEFSITATDHGIIKQIGTITNMPYPIIDTEAKDGATLTDTAMAVRNAQIIDTVTYKHLTINTTYKVRGYLMDKNTGLQVVDANNNPIVAETAEFTTPASSSLSDHNVDGKIDNVFNFDATAYRGCTFVVYEELYQKVNDQWVLVTEHKDINDEAQTIYFVSLDTKASIKGTDSQVGIANGEVTIVDKVWYKGFNKNYEYRIEGALYIAETGEPVLGLDGKPVVTKQYFTTSDREGDLEVEFTFNANQLKGKSVVIVQKVYWNGSLFIEHNADLTDTNEMIYFPEISTTAIDTVTRDHISLASEDAKIIDTVEYTNLPVGNQYTLKGILMDKATGKPVMVNGKEVTEEVTFTPTIKDSTVDVTFEFDSTDLKGTEFVVFEELYYDDVLIAEHADIGALGQTITVPKIGTTAIDSETLDHTSTLDKEITIVDTIEYTNVLAGKKYTIKGIIMDKETKAPLLIDGKTVVAETTFTADNTSGSVKLEYTMNSINLRGKTIVVFEDMYYGDKLIATHSDINDENQTVDFPEPEIGTTARDSETETNVSYADEEVTIIDTVNYKNLVPEEEYTIKGILMLKSTGKPLLVDGKEITSEVTFKPEKAEDFVELTYTFNGSALRGDAVVVFETLYYNDLEVATHADIDDEGQTVYFPEITTVASLSDGSKKLPFGIDVSVVDRITYSGLAPNLTYEVRGILIDKSTGKPLETENGVVETKLQFTTENSSGTVDTVFSFNTTEISGKELVVYEEIYEVESGKLVAEHKDINDENQTVSVDKPGPPTGDTFPATLVLLATLLSLVGIVTILFRKKLSN